MTPEQKKAGNKMERACKIDQDLVQPGFRATAEKHKGPNKCLQWRF